MKFYHLSRVIGGVSGWCEVAMAHVEMFHGWKRGPYDDRRLTAPCEPLEIWRSGHWVPDVSETSTDLVIREHVKQKLKDVPNIAFLPVRWGKLVDLPHCAPGDFSFLRNPAYVRATGKEERLLDEMYHGLPDVPSLHEGFPTCYELLMHNTEIGEGKYPLREMEVESAIGPVDVVLSAELLRDFPIVFDMGIIFSEAVWPLIAPHIDRDFFEVVEGEV